MKTNTEGMTEEQLRALQKQKNRELNEARKNPQQGARIRELRDEVLSIQAEADVLMAIRVAGYETIAAGSLYSQSTIVDADAAAAISEAEKLLGT